MSPINVGIIGIIIFVLLLLFRMPIGFAMAAVGFAGITYFRGIGPAFSVLGSLPYFTIASYVMSAITFFVVMGELAFYSGLGTALYVAAYKWVGQLRGGLAVATFVACAFFATLSGSSFASAATMGSVALPEMKKYKYAPSLATGSVAAGGTLGILIPPSIAFVVYGVLVEESVGKLLLAGFLPGILLTFLFALSVYITCKINPSLGPPGPKSSLKEKMTALSQAWPVLVVFVAMIGGLYAGVFTPTEAGAVGAAVILFVGIARKTLSLKKVLTSTMETMLTVGMIFGIFIGAFIFNSFLAFTHLPFALANALAGFASPYLVIVLIIMLFIFLGCFVDVMAMVILIVPIIFPLLKAMGFDPIWFGVIIVMMAELGVITPPFGMNVYIIGDIAKDVPLSTIFKGVIPFIVAILVCVALVVAFPQIALFLPSTMK